MRLIIENGETIGEVNEIEAERRRTAVHAVAGSFAGIYPPGYLDELRSEWPE